MSAHLAKRIQWLCKQGIFHRHLIEKIIQGRCTVADAHRIVQVNRSKIKRFIQAAKYDRRLCTDNFTNLKYKHITREIVESGLLSAHQASLLDDEGLCAMNQEEVMLLLATGFIQPHHLNRFNSLTRWLMMIDVIVNGIKSHVYTVEQILAIEDRGVQPQERRGALECLAAGSISIQQLAKMTVPEWLKLNSSTLQDKPQYRPMARGASEKIRSEPGTSKVDRTSDEKGSMGLTPPPQRLQQTTTTLNTNEKCIPQITSTPTTQADMQPDPQRTLTPGSKFESPGS